MRTHTVLRGTSEFDVSNLDRAAYSSNLAFQFRISRVHAACAHPTYLLLGQGRYEGKHCSPPDTRCNPTECVVRVTQSGAAQIILHRFASRWLTHAALYGKPYLMCTAPAHFSFLVSCDRTHSRACSA